MAIETVEYLNAKDRKKNDTFIALESEYSENLASDPILYLCRNA